MVRFSDDKFDDTYLTTIGVDFRFKSLKIDDLNVKL
jgi:Ras-related protein Rab-1A